MLLALNVQYIWLSRGKLNTFICEQKQLEHFSKYSGYFSQRNTSNKLYHNIVLKQTHNIAKNQSAFKASKNSSNNFPNGPN